jgi:DNA-binding LacI/PurR family transcriptional regulator
MVASIEDVARRAGVSIATVSRALRGLPDVATATRDRVLAAAADLNYVASPFAARLASGRTATVGLVVPWVNRWFFAEVIATVETELRQAGFDLLLYNLGDADGRARFFEMMPVRKRVDGLIIASLVLEDDEYDKLAAIDRPVGLLGMPRPGFVSARIDDDRGARQAVEHLVALGHQRIGLIGGDSDVPMRYTPPLHRREGYRAALRDAGLDLDPELETLGYFTVEGGAAAAEELLALAKPPTAIFCESDEMAYGALRTIRRRGLSVPQDVAVIGFDDQPMAELLDLSTIRQPVEQQAWDVTLRLLGAINGAAEADLGDAVLPTELVVRGSTDITRSVS